MTSSRPSEDATTAATRDKAIKTRIINHMNADHASSLRLYLQHYNNMSSSEVAGTVQLEDITFDHLLVNTGNKTRIYVPIDPPMKSFSEARERMVSMHQSSLTALKLSDLQITTYAPPNRVWEWGLLSLCIWIYISFPFSHLILPPPSSGHQQSSFAHTMNTIIHNTWSIYGLVPGLASLAHRFSHLTLLVMTSTHAVETWYFEKTRLRKHQVPHRGTVWWAWMVNCFVTGAGAFARFDDLVKQKEEEKKIKDKH